jgi:hypothetical protein
METFYRHIIKGAWQIMIKTPLLWFFGLFAAIAAIVSEYNILLYPSDLYEFTPLVWLVSLIKIWQETGLTVGKFFGGLWHLLLTQPLAVLSMFAVYAIILAAFLFVLWLVIASQVALISGTQKAQDGKKNEFRQLINIGRQKFWPALGFNALLKAIIIGLSLLLFFLILYFLQFSTWGVIGFTISFIIITLLVLVCSLITKFALCFLTLENQDFIQALIAAAKMFGKQWLISLEMAILVFVINFVAALGIALVSAVLTLPFLLLIYLTATLHFVLGFFLSVIIGLLVILGLIFLTSAMLSTWSWSAWTLLFIRLQTEGGQSKIIRLSQKLPAWFTK